MIILFTENISFPMNVFNWWPKNCICELCMSSKSTNSLAVGRDSRARRMLQFSTENYCYLHKLLSSRTFKWVYLIFLANAQHCYTTEYFLLLSSYITCRWICYKLFNFTNRIEIVYNLGFYPVIRDLGRFKRAVKARNATRYGELIGR